MKQCGRQKRRRTEAVGEKQETGKKCGRQEAGRAGEENTGKAQRRDAGKTGAGAGEKGWRKGKEEKTEHKPGLRQRTWRGPMRSPKSRLAWAEQRM